MEQPAWKYLVHYYKDGKVFDQEFCDTEYQVRVLQAMARQKNCEIEVSYMNLETQKDSPTGIVTQKIDTEKKTWERPVVCVETGQLFTSIRECSNYYNIPYKSLYNAIRSGMPRKKLHFIFDGEELKIKDVKITKKKRMSSNSKNCRKKKLLCTTTGKIFNSVTEMFAELPEISAQSFYKSIKKHTTCKGLAFKYIK